MAHIPKHRALPDKENKLFRELLTQYELKQYKKGIKAADTILKKFPNHGETIALKALTIHSSLPDPMTASAVPKKEEAEAMARLAVKKDITSHITWHVLGIFAKSERNWDEASRAFAQARRLDPDNIPLIRDSISLLTHTRQYAQALQARHHFLTLRPQIRATWLGLVLAHHLAGDADEAIRVYNDYAEATAIDGATAPEKAQTLMYVITLCIEAGRKEEALQRLEEGVKEKVISPRGQISLTKAQLLSELGRAEEAANVWEELLKQNSDSLEYYRGYFRAKGLDLAGPHDAAAQSALLESLEQLSQTYPRSAAPRRLALDVAQDETFLQLAQAYIVKGLERGVPSLFVDVKSVYADSSKMTVVGEIVQEIVSKLEKESTLANDGSIAPPTVLLWAYYYLALHLSHPLNPSPNYTRSLELIDSAITHTPTLPELYMAKAIVLKRAGDPQGAAHEMEKARLLDGQDRFLNGKAAKYWLRAGNIEKAEELLAMFTKKGMTPVQDLTDLQCVWFLQEEGDAYRRSQNRGMALKRYQTVVNVFKEYEDDQYDFHGYCTRRDTFSAYTELLNYEDNLRRNPHYAKAALALIAIYTEISDDPSLTVEHITPEEEAERKRLAKKAQKAESKAKKAAATSGDKKEEPPLPDEDPKGEKLLKSETPLDDAEKVWKALERLQGEKVETWLAGYEIFSRKKLYPAAIRSLLTAQSIAPSHPTLHYQILNFVRLNSSADLPAPIAQVIEQSLPTLLGGKDAKAASEAFVEQATKGSDAEAIVGAAKGHLEVDPTDVSGANSILSTIASTSVPPSAQTYLSALAFISSRKGVEEAQVEELRKKLEGRMPLAWALKSGKEQGERKEALEKEAQEGEVEGKTDL
ncbi:hypothetical protein IAR50_004455 [Cryptococcus sp. DSM 104548]